jgi:hypothetical protein
VIRLIAPDGTEYEAATPVEANDLRFGHGYRIAPDEPAKARSEHTPAPQPTRSADKPSGLGDGG